jgi:uncharacterized protein
VVKGRMTDITPLIKSNQMVIQHYGPQGFKISGNIYSHHVIVLPDRVLPWDGTSFDALLAIKDDIDVVILGTGKTVKHPKKETKPQGLHFDVMDTGAACRAYNALMADGRRIAAALVMPL